ncbi:glycoside hydrolase family 12 protein [Mixia osmundae IAM 14324]|uniref:Uncharacterized protein n=1 Tax=Mixia osmundae (strain CBS 9802 / IAM 14324 / JCM 22182 / KY 12970) TaxID=764103 RepID=G7DXX4_MIXOS|nr:glycoside hydrolase family 12 protein [Mixia osmundae IAM 14324]KEI41338.1 glycoside hydrolase family 12 protein [Mixia osmundae IAM 14324]GAA95434.1 hypothetical protein E5Q_02088 [Mixia osmundae IAM 14324]
MLANNILSTILLASAALAKSELVKRSERHRRQAPAAIVEHNVCGNNYDFSANKLSVEGGDSVTTELNVCNGDIASYSATWSVTSAPGALKASPGFALANIGGKQLSSLKNIHAYWVWEWAQVQPSTSSLIGYHIYLGSAPNAGKAGAQTVVNIYLSAHNKNPLGDVVATDDIGGHRWQLYQSQGTSQTVFSFMNHQLVPGLKHFAMELEVFLAYLQAHLSVSSALYIVAVESNIEIYGGSGSLLTKEWQMTLT